jgi:hypothetical protein
MARPHHFRLLAWAAAAACTRNSEVPRFSLHTEPPLRSDLNQAPRLFIGYHRVDGADGLLYALPA